MTQLKNFIGWLAPSQQSLTRQWLRKERVSVTASFELPQEALPNDDLDLF
jgi:hypothetical protein